MFDFDLNLKVSLNKQNRKVIDQLEMQIEYWIYFEKNFLFANKCKYGFKNKIISFIWIRICLNSFLSELWNF